ncbi:DUF4859 domain-containing protein [Labilibaculum sp. K2S]|uniref:DUF4859 domain-containing protein n=1 Tax=Labilibaculum sp. K2S TaxID=3056386 RepID=UPI0025A3E14C|nr:DUF4859 domain-containing protein [Labilibaculum sp. K2S]MDM8159569.1 DUF4859 domain-containing protein [Labilibaculum sp. K2S]
MNQILDKRPIARLNHRMLFTLIIFTLFFLACSGSNLVSDEDEKDKPDSETPKADTTAFDKSKFYVPLEFKDNDYTSTSSTWCYERSKQSDHFILFWAAGYGKNDPGATEVPDNLRVDIDDLLGKAEVFYDLNVNTLKFAETGVGKSNLDQYKMQIYLFHQEEWMAFGAGYDDTIGALWVNPGTVQPVGAVIAHEIGHSFQYQTFCDLGGKVGFRYGFGGNGGNAFWEQTAQWQSFQAYPEQVFENNNFPVYCENCFRHVCHEDYRYASYFIHYYWAEKHGIDIIGKIWREAQEPEDPIEAYMRITNITLDQLNDEIYDAAAKCVTWDLDSLREYGVNHVGQQSFKSTIVDHGSYQVSYDRCPGTTGYNTIRLNVPDEGTEISTEFTGLVNASGFNHVADENRAGWRYGYVALLENGSRVYSVVNKESHGNAVFTVPSGCAKLWLVVTGAPNTYAAHPWDDDDTNDDQWPYKVKFTNTDLYGNIVFDGTEVPEDLTLTYDVKFSSSSTGYTGSTVSIDLTKLVKALVLQSSEISDKIGNEITFYGVESNETLNITTTATGLGHWFDIDGNICAYGDNAKVFSEFDKTNFTFSIGQYPGHCSSGNQFKVKQTLVYQYAAGKKVQATFVFNIAIQ